MDRDDELFFALVRAGMMGERLALQVPDDAWTWLYGMAARQSVLGVCYQPQASMPKELAIRWAAMVETIAGLNRLQYHEAAIQTAKYSAAGCQSAILKGQANARLYPNKFVRQPGDVDIWVEGGRQHVMAVLGMHLSSQQTKGTLSYHHVHLPKNKRGIDVEVHFRPSSGNCNPFTNRRLQHWLEQEIKTLTAVEEHFNVPSIRFALMMQLAHIQRHFISSGVGMRHVCDYYVLLQQATDDDRRVVSVELKRFGLYDTAAALMWVLGHVLKLNENQMLCKPDAYRGQWLLRDMMDGGDFGRYATSKHHCDIRRIIENRWRHLKLLRFSFAEVFWGGINFWVSVIRTMPQRIRYRTLSLRHVSEP